MTDNNQILQAIYETQRQNIILAWLNPQVRPSLDVALVHAYQYRMFPTYHNDKHIEQFAPFNDVYQIKREIVEQVLEYVADRSNNHNYANISFAELQQTFVHEEDITIKLINILRYAYLIDGKFSEETYEAIVDSAGGKTEAKQIFNRQIIVAEDASFHL